MRARGLKYPASFVELARAAVAPYVGSWIEIETRNVFVVELLSKLADAQIGYSFVSIILIPLSTQRLRNQQWKH